MRFIIFCISFISFVSVATAAMDLKPGLWKVSVATEANGKNTKVANPFADMEKAMKKMPPEQRKKMQELMAKSKFGVASDGSMQVCYSKKMLENPGSNSKKSDQKCDLKIMTNTQSKSVTHMTCKDGMTADITMTRIDSENFTSNMDITKNGKKTMTKSKGTFVSGNCGNVKPILE